MRTLTDIADEYYKHEDTDEADAQAKSIDWYTTRGMDLEVEFLGTILLRVAVPEPTTHQTLQLGDVVMRSVTYLITKDPAVVDDDFWNTFYDLFSSFETKEE